MGLQKIYKIISIVLVVAFMTHCGAKGGSGDETPNPPSQGMVIRSGLFFSGGLSSSSQYSMTGHFTPYASTIMESDSYLALDVTIQVE